MISSMLKNIASLRTAMFQSKNVSVMKETMIQDFFSINIFFSIDHEEQFFFSHNFAISLREKGELQNTKHCVYNFGWFRNYW